MNIKSLINKKLIIWGISELILIPFYVVGIRYFYLRKGKNVLYYFLFLIISRILLWLWFKFGKININNYFIKFIVDILVAYILTAFTYLIDLNPYTNIFSRYFYFNSFYIHSLVPVSIFYGVISFILKFQNFKRNIFYFTIFFYLFVFVSIGADGIIFQILYLFILLFLLVILWNYFIKGSNELGDNGKKIIPTDKSKTMDEEIRKIQALILMGYSNEKILEIMQGYDYEYIDKLKRELFMNKIK